MIPAVGKMRSHATGTRDGPDAVSRAKDYAFRFLAVRGRSEAEVRRRLVQQGYPQEIVDAVIDDLKGYGYVDDRKFAKSWASSRMASGRSGPGLIRAELARLGVPRDAADEAVAEAWADVDEEAHARELARKRLSRYSGEEPHAAARKLGSFLLRRGFSQEVAQKVVRDLVFRAQGVEHDG